MVGGCQNSQLFVSFLFFLPHHIYEKMEKGVSRFPVKLVIMSGVHDMTSLECRSYYEKSRRKCRCPGWRLLGAVLSLLNRRSRRIAARQVEGASVAAAPLGPSAAADRMRENLLLFHPPQQVKEEPNQPHGPEISHPQHPQRAAGWVRVGWRKEGSRRIWLADAQTREKSSNMMPVSAIRSNAPITC